MDTKQCFFLVDITASAGEVVHACLLWYVLDLLHCAGLHGRALVRIFYIRSPTLEHGLIFPNYTLDTRPLEFLLSFR